MVAASCDRRGTADRGAALRLALQWEDASKAARAKTFTAAQAHKILRECVALSTGEPLQTFTCRQWLEEWLAGKSGATAGQTATKYKGAVKGFLSDLGARADVVLGAVSLKDIRTWRDQRRRAGLSVTTCNQAVKLLKSAFGRAVSLGYLAVNPCAALEPLRDSEDASRDVFSQDQIVTLVKTAQGDWRGLILFGFFTGLRLSDAANLSWDSSDLEKGLLRLRTKKTGVHVTIPLHSDLLAWLAQQPCGVGKAPLFPSLHGTSGAGKSGLSSQFKRIMERAHIGGRILRAATGVGRKQSSLSFHSLRHSFVSALSTAGIAPDLRQKLAGHTDSKSHARYSHHAIDAMRSAVATVPSLASR
jgi:integrase